MGGWAELRSTAPGILDELGYRVELPLGGERQQTGIFNIVLDESDGHTRALPRLHHGRALIFADRDIHALGERIQRALEVIDAQDTQAAYMANAIRIGDRYGLYTRGSFNRESFRLHLKRLGVEFANDPYSVLSPDGAWQCRDWGRFSPSFMIVGGPYPDDPEAVEDRQGGLVPFMFGVLRVGRITAPELALLGRFVRTAPLLASFSPRAIVESLTAAA
ncbi:MAG TPA: hypothetical protein VIG64_05815 [Actinomycetota bacterium]|jgi:hypothetical protein